MTFTDVIRFDALTCGSFKLPYVLSKSITIQGASDNPLYNTLDAYTNNAMFTVTGSGVKVYFNRLQLTRGNVRTPSLVKPSAYIFTECRYLN